MGARQCKQQAKGKDCELNFQVDPTQMTLPEACRLYYKDKVFPLEEALCLDNVYQPPIADGEFGAPPLLLFLGPFSSGKTTMIRYLLQMDYPGMEIGPEPSSERYSIIMHGQRQLLSLHTLIDDEAFPYREVWRFGSAYVDKTFCAYCPSSVLRNMVIVDTPGVTSVDRAYVSRKYDYESVIRYWADRADRIVLVFDVFKMELPDEMRRLVSCIQPYEDKCLIVLNKADSVPYMEVQRAIDSLTWSLGRLLKQNEIPTVHVGSYWEKQCSNQKLQPLFVEYEKRLMLSINRMEKEVDQRRLNDLILRAKITYSHALISRMLTGRFNEAEMSQKRFHRHLMKKLQHSVYPKLVQKMRIRSCDLPHPVAVYKQLTDPCYDTKKHPVSRQQIEMLKDFLVKDLPNLIKATSQPGSMEPFDVPTVAKARQGYHMITDDWCTVKKAAEDHGWDLRFRSLKPHKGKVGWLQMKLTMDMTGLSTTTLLYIWSLVDTDKDGRIDEYQFYLFNWLVEQVLMDRPLPNELPKALKPPQHVPDKQCKKKRLKGDELNKIKKC